MIFYHIRNPSKLAIIASLCCDIDCTCFINAFSHSSKLTGSFFEDEILECFRNGGGVPYSSYKNFHAVMLEESDQTIVSQLIEKILPLDNSVIEKLQQGIHVCDFGCGSGHALITMATHFQKSKFIGYDISEEAINNAKKSAEQHKLKNIKFNIQDVSKLNSHVQFDLITAFDAIHDQGRPDIVLKHIYGLLKPDGIFLMHDIKVHTDLEKNYDNPLATFIYTISCLHCMTVSLSQNGMGLGAAWGKEQAIQMLHEAGFKSINVHELEHDLTNYYYIIKKKLI